MIVIDTSALMAIVLKEPAAGVCSAAAERDPDLAMSAGTAAEAMIVADCRRVGRQMRALIERLAIQIIAVTPAGAGQVAEAYKQWGKGNHPASLNLGDCFAYALANRMGCALLFTGNDFSRTDIKSALS